MWYSTQIPEYNCTRVFIIILSTKILKSTVRVYLVIKLWRNVRMYHKVLVQKQINENELCCNPSSRHILLRKMTHHRHHISKRDYNFTKKDILCNYNRLFDLHRQADIREVTGGCWLMTMVCASCLAMPRCKVTAGHCDWLFWLPGHSWQLDWFLRLPGHQTHEGRQAVVRRHWYASRSLKRTRTNKGVCCNFSQDIIQ